MCSEEDRCTNDCVEFEEIPNSLKIVCKCNIFDTHFCKYAYALQNNIRIKEERQKTSKKSKELMMFKSS